MDWKELIWLEKPAQFLTRFVNNPSGSILIQGPRGTGVFELANAFAGLLLCEEPEDGKPCGKCAGCRLFQSGNHPDYCCILSPQEAEIRGVEARGEKKGEKKTVSRLVSIDQIREIGEFASVTSHRAGKKVVVVYPANMMQPDASSALLKTLEEPPGDTFLILATEDADAMLPTIRSRCQIVRVPPPRWEEGVEFLKKKKVASPEEVLAAVGGLPLLAFEQDPKLRLPEERQSQLLDLLLMGSSSKLVKIFDSSSKEISLPALIPFLQRFTADLIYCVLGLEPRYFRSKAERIKSFSSGLSLPQLYAYLDELNGLSKFASHPLNATLTFQDLIVKFRKAVRKKP